jgi:peptidoglycan/xylan/chitin deacetylase (PgdA/CDA1 family)
MLTHDVEGVEGQARCRELAELESKHGMRSCFNIVAERYPVDLDLMRELLEAGFEIGLHGIKHDGKKFSSRSVFEQRLESMRHYRGAWNVDGFRSPATHRRWEWMGDLPFAYDSSYPDTDPYEPMPGGCGSPWPFHIGSILELPITLPQDHTLWEILHRPALPVWRAKLAWLRACGGLATLIVHPDYLTNEERWAEYSGFLSELQEQQGVWVALPREVAAWWTSLREPHQEVTLAEHRDGHCLVFA